MILGEILEFFRWILSNIIVLALGGLITKLIEIFLPGSIRYRLRLWWGYACNYFRNPDIHAKNVWIFYLGEEYVMDELQEHILNYFIQQKVKAFNGNDNIKFEIEYNDKKLEGFLYFGVSGINEDKILVNQIEVVVETTLHYREFFEGLLALREAIHKNIIAHLVTCLNQPEYSSVLEVKINKLEEVTKIIDDLKVKYISLGDKYRIYLVGKYIRITDIVDKSVLRALKTLLALYL
ncbi:hypothetical protein J4526_01830 [Desulfurococcaceae archaeon MEX13E-LK6-19]|nr:hypothetical protein J4526_01830 [Desulfurococcaceae archaeon MEX13E-LK6-19]